MFSAVYLVCIMNGPCQFYVDTDPYPTYESCMIESQRIMQSNQERVAKGEFIEHTSEAQCISWEKA